MTAHKGADENLAEAKRIFTRCEDVGNVTANADPLSCSGNRRRPVLLGQIMVRGDARVRGQRPTAEEAWE